LPVEVQVVVETPETLAVEEGLVTVLSMETVIQQLTVQALAEVVVQQYMDDQALVLVETVL
jgi:hypothetical protein